MTIQTTTTATFFGLRQKPQASSAHHLKGRRTKPDHLLESFIFGFFRSGVRVAFYLACAYAAKIVLGGGGHLSLALR